MAKPNYSFEKRKKELDRKKKKEEKLHRKLDKGSEPEAGQEEAGTVESEAIPDLPLNL